MEARMRDEGGLAQTLEWLLTSFLHGFKDLFSGIFRATSFQQAKKTQEPEQPQSTLAMRRAAAAKAKQQAPPVEPAGRKQTMRETVITCLLFNTVMLVVSVVVFRGAKSMLEHLFANSTIAMFVLSWTSQLLTVAWELPTFILAKTLTSFWNNTIADLSFEGTNLKRQSYAVKDTIADLIFSIIMDLLFHLQGHLLYAVISHLGMRQLAYVLYILHSSWLYSLYAFEYKWYLLGYLSEKRAFMMESNWAYHLGFGLPLVLVSHISSNYYISAVIFSTVLVVGIIASMLVNEPRDISVKQLRMTWCGIKLADALFIFLGKYCMLRSSVKRQAASSSVHNPSPSPSPSPSHSSSPASVQGQPRSSARYSQSSPTRRQ